MKLNRSTLVVPLTAVLLVAAAGAVMATSGGPAAPVAQAPAAATPTPTPSPGTTKQRVQKETVLTGVLDDLVAKGTITEAQKQAVLDGVAAERAARVAALKAAREQAKADRQQIKDFLADGVITKEEFDKLPAASPLRKLTTLMDDGRITNDELKALGRGLGGKFFGGHGWRGQGDHKGAKPSPSPSPAAGTSG